MKQAIYDVANVGHFGLASKAYLHFTSPIRRYPDVCVHRIAHAVLENRPVGRDEAARAKLAEAALAASTAERKAMDVERAVVDLYRTFVMKRHIGKRFEGTVTAVVGSGLFVQIDAPFVDVLVRLEDLGGDRWEVDDEALRVVASRSGEAISLGDRMVVEITDAAILRRTIYARRAGAKAEGRRNPYPLKGDKRGPHRPKPGKHPAKKTAASGHDRRNDSRPTKGPKKKSHGPPKGKGKKGRRR
jgi:ribonuclease R